MKAVLTMMTMIEGRGDSEAAGPFMRRVLVFGAWSMKLDSAIFGCCSAAVVQATASVEGSAYTAEASISKIPTSATHLSRRDLFSLSPVRLPFSTIY